MLISLIYPVIFVIVLWIVHVVAHALDAEIYRWGILPQDAAGLRGIFFSPFIHGSFSHLASNSLPLLVLGSALFYFYREVAFQVVAGSILITGVWVWVIARESYHIGASGVVYSLAAFLFVSGILRRHPRLMALSLIVAFLYGGLVWGIFPIKDQVSWESHLMGLLAGVILAVFYKNHGPQRPLYSWELEEDEEEGQEDKEETKDSNADNANEMLSSPEGNESSTTFRYVYKPRRSKSR